eukprot:3690658-Ditylum_brightwellii.AAC.1
MKLHQPLGVWRTQSSYTARQYYYAQSTNHIYALKEGTCTSVPDDVIIHTVRKFGSTLYCKGPLTVAQAAAEASTVTVTHTQGIFEDYVATQLHHVQRILGMLQVAEVDTEYWIDALNKGIVMIATDMHTYLE